MSSVRIIVDAGYLGDIEVTRDNRITSTGPMKQRMLVDELIDTAVAQVRAELKVEP